MFRARRATSALTMFARARRSSSFLGFDVSARMEVSYNTSTGARCLPPAVTRFARIGRRLAGGLAAQRCLCS
jgi:hypothetical protein